MDVATVSSISAPSLPQFRHARDGATTGVELRPALVWAHEFGRCGVRVNAVQELGPRPGGPGRPHRHRRIRSCRRDRQCDNLFWLRRPPATSTARSSMEDLLSLPSVDKHTRCTSVVDRRLFVNRHYFSRSHHGAHFVGPTRIADTMTGLRARRTSVRVSDHQRVGLTMERHRSDTLRIRSRIRPADLAEHSRTGDGRAGATAGDHRSPALLDRPAA